DLIAHLHRITAVDENRSLFGQHRRGSGRAAETGQPRHALCIVADIFAHMLVADRPDEAVEAAGGEFGADTRETLCMEGAGHGCFLVPTSETIPSVRRYRGGFCDARYLDVSDGNCHPACRIARP